MNHNYKIQTFTDLVAWKVSYKLVLYIYKQTKIFPKEELFGLTSQLRRAGVSVTSNIAEGFSRRTKKDKEHFYSMSIGSLKEIENQLILARDLKYISNTEFSDFAELITQSSKLLSGLQKSTIDKAP